jgi:RNA polymerase sigma-70 factor (ECF subfamily)
VQPQRLHLDDLAVRDRILRGDRPVAEELFQRSADALFEFVYYRIGRDRAAAEDVVQDTLLVAYDKLGEFDGRSSLYTWLCGIAKNKVRSGRRKLRPVRMEDLLEDADPEIESILSSIESEPLPDAVVEAKETAELVGATLSSLPPDYREALLDKYVEGRAVPEMARASGHGVKAMESRLHRARKAFSRVFQLLAKQRGGVA